jgi:hypothetical protein
MAVICGVAIYTDPDAAQSHGSTITDLLSDWVNGQEKIALSAILQNVGPAAGAADGLIIASPSRKGSADEPDYYVRGSSPGLLLKPLLIRMSAP